MDSEPSQWEKIFQRDGRVFADVPPPVRQFADTLIKRGPISVLDLGCGTGRHIVHMAQKGLYVTGLDNAPTALQLAGEWLKKERLDANLVLSDMRQPLPFGSESFDAVLSTQVIHHALLADVRGTAREIQRIVCRGGMILVSVPTRKAIAEDAPQHIEIEPDTFIPTTGDEQGLPHHLFAPEELQDIFPQFETLALRVIDNRIITLTALKI
jgi:SAM-dependent methyltransferase